MFKMSQFQAISGKKLRGYCLRPVFQTPLYFFETEYRDFMTLYKHYAINTLKSIQLRFFYILINIKYSSHNHISKSQNNRPFIKHCSMYLKK
jgi:hypothetical protein